MNHFRTTIEIMSLGREITLHVEGSQWAEEPQTWDCPGEPAGFEVHNVWHDGAPQDSEHDISDELSDEESETIEEATAEALQADAQAAAEAAAEAAYEARMASLERWY